MRIKSVKMAIMNTIMIVLPILTVLMFDLGLTLKADDFTMVFKKPMVVFIALFGQIILLPALAFAIAVFFQLPPALLIGLVLIGCCPGGSSSNLFTRVAGGDVALSVSLTAFSSIITLVTLPAVMHVVTGFAGNAVGITLPVGNLIKQNLLLMLLPVVLGILLHQFKPAIAQAIDRVLSKTVFPALLILVSIFFVQNRRVIAANLLSVGGCVTALIIASALLAAFLSRAFRFEGRIRKTIVIEVGMQNAAQAIAVASSPFIFNSSEIAIPGILYSLMMNLILLGYLAIIKVRERAYVSDATPGN